MDPVVPAVWVARDVSGRGQCGAGSAVRVACTAHEACAVGSVCLVCVACAGDVVYTRCVVCNSRQVCALQHILRTSFASWKRPKERRNMLAGGGGGQGFF